MDAATLRKDTIPFVPRASSANISSPLQLGMNPFVAGAHGSRMGRPLQAAFGELIRQIGLQTATVVVAGNAGTGKSLLMDMSARACLEMGMTVRRVERGDQVHTAFGAKSDVLLVDQADSISNSCLQILLSPEGKDTATTMVFMSLPTSVGRFNFAGTPGAIIELTPLALSDSRNYLQERAASIGRPNLFTPEALDLIIDGSRGLPRLLRSIAHLAFLAAASEGAAQIGVQHVSNTLETRSAEGHNADVGAAAHLRQVETVPQVKPKPLPDPPAPRIAFENHKRAADITAQPSVGANTKTASPPQIGQQQVADALASWSAPNAEEKYDHDALSILAGEAVAEAPRKAPSVSPARNPSPPKAMPATPVKEFARPQTRSDVWLPRAAGMAGVLAATVVIGAAIPMLMNSKPSNVLRAAAGPITIARPVESPKAAAPAPALATTNSVNSPQQAPTRTDTAIASDPVAKPAAAAVNPTKPVVASVNPSKAMATPRSAPSIAVPAQAKVQPVPQTPVVTNTAVQPARPAPASEQASIVNPIDDTARAEREAADRIKAASDQAPAAVKPVEPPAPVNDPAAQAAAQKLAAEKAAAEKAAAERDKAAVQAFLLAQEAGRQAKAAREAAEQAKAEKDAVDREKSARQNANKVFSYSLLGFGK